jgi:hypothetical protein
MQVYNLGIDEQSHKSSASVEYRIRKDNQEIAKFTETSAQLGQSGEQITIEKLVPLATLAPGKYKVEIEVTDNVSKKSISPSAEFTVKAAEKAAAKN